MPKICVLSNICGLGFGLGALILHITSLPMAWFPDSPAGKLMEATGQFKTQVTITPIIGVIVIVVALVLLVLANEQFLQLRGLGQVSLQGNPA